MSIIGPIPEDVVYDNVPVRYRKKLLRLKHDVEAVGGLHFMHYNSPDRT